MTPRPPRYTLTSPLFPYTKLVRSRAWLYSLLSLPYRELAARGDDSGDVRFSRRRDRRAARRLAAQDQASARHETACLHRRARCAAVGEMDWPGDAGRRSAQPRGRRSEEHTSELQSLMRISYAVFCLKKKY